MSLMDGHRGLESRNKNSTAHTNTEIACSLLEWRAKAKPVRFRKVETCANNFFPVYFWPFYFKDF